MTSAVQTAVGGRSDCPVEVLGSLGRWIGGGTPSKAEPAFWTNGTVPWVSAKDMKTDIIERSADLITDEAVARSSAKLIPPGSVLCVMRSGILAHTFPVAVSAVEVTINQDLRALVVRDGVDPHYLAHFLRFAGGDILLNCSKHGTTVSSIEASRLDRYPVPLPDLDTQRRIVARIEQLFSELNDGEEELARARADLETYRKALLKAAVTGELTADWRQVAQGAPTSAELLATIASEREARWSREQSGRKAYRLPETANTSSLPDLPADWVWATMDQLSTRVTKGSSPGWQGFDYVEHGVLFVRSQNVGWGSLRLADRVYVDPSFNDVESKAVIEAGDVLLNIVGASIGRACRADGRLAGANSNQAVAGIRPVMDALSDYLVLWLLSPPGQAIIFGGVVETARANFSLEQLRAMPVPLPSLEEMSQILSRYADMSASAGEKLESMDELADGAALLRQSILAAAFRGELVQ